MLWRLWTPREMLSDCRASLQQLQSVSALQTHWLRVTPPEPRLQAMDSTAMQTHWQLVGPHSRAMRHCWQRPWSHSSVTAAADRRQRRPPTLTTTVPALERLRKAPVGSPSLCRPGGWSASSGTCFPTMAAGPWNMATLQHLQAVTLVEVHQCRADTLAAALPRVPLDRLTLECCHVWSLPERQQVDGRAGYLPDRWVQGLYMRGCRLLPQQNEQPQ